MVKQMRFEAGTLRDLVPSWMVLALALSGCTSRSVPAGSVPAAVPPGEIQVDGRVWRLQSVTDADRQAVDRYLRGNAAIAENPTLQGSMACYLDDRGHRRAYWLYIVESSCQWLYLEFDRHRRFVRVDEGADGPLALAQSSG